MKAENIECREALIWFIGNFNIEGKFDLSNFQIKPKTEEEIKKENALRQKSLLLEEVVRYGKNKLFEPHGKAALDYLLTDRRYDSEVLKNTEFIYLSPEEEVKRHLLNEFPDAAEQIRQLKLSGYYGDNFRLAFPYRNEQGQITGLLKRATAPKGIDIKTYDGKEHKSVRWDSTPGTTKEALFRLNECRGFDTLLVVEGYPDALYWSKCGLDNIVAVGQGRLSKSHLEGLKKSRTKNVIISFDNDEVGPKNTEDAVRLLIEESEITPYVLDPKALSPHKDPDEFIRANGVEAFKALIRKTEKGIFWLCSRIIQSMSQGDPITKQSSIGSIFSLARYITDPVEIEEFKTLIGKQLGISDSTIKAKIKSEIENSRIEQYKKLKEKSETGEKRYVPFIEKSTSSYAYYDYREDELYLGVAYQVLDNIVASAEQKLSDVLPVLKADFYVDDDNRIDYEKERFNFFVPTAHMLLKKTDEKLDPRKSFPHIYRLLSNLIPNYQERKLFLNWLSGILQFRKKHITAWLLKGKQGTGKNVLIEHVLKPLFGSKQTKVVDDAELQRDFNPWLQNALLIAFNEVAHDNNSRNSINSKIKAIITDSTAIINEKNVKTYTVKNYANCLFFSNEAIPLFIEDGDRRFNVVSTGEKLTSFPWFKNDPEGFLKSLEDEVAAFAQFLMNWRYDAVKANTCINNKEKEKMVGACMNRFEEFAYRLKRADVDWFKSGMSNALGMNMVILPEEDIKEGRIEKNTAIQLFKEIYSDLSTGKTGLTQKLSHYGIETLRDKTNSQHFYVWK